MRIYRFLTLSAITGSLLIGGCQHRVKYTDSGSDQILSTDFSASDLRQIAEKMVDSLLTFPPLLEKMHDVRPVISVDRVRNKTSQHIDTESITDSIRARIIKSRSFRFIDRTTDASAVDELTIQKETGLVDPAKTVPIGQQYGAEYLLTGSISEIEQRAGTVKDVYYKFTLNLKNLRTGILEWSDEKEIRKIRKRSLLGL